ncbi:putative jasmonic acid carboxyl methyltransferase 1, partial [Drosera capensis]
MEIITKTRTAREDFSEDHVSQSIGTRSSGAGSVVKSSTDEGKVITSRKFEKFERTYSAKLPKCVNIVELGSSSGPNALTVLSDIITVTDMTYREMNHPMPELKVFLNDLPRNDFNTIFRSLPSFFKHLEEEPTRHATSRELMLPKGLVGNKEAATMKRNICVTKEGPPDITKAYQEQFGDDFTLFLRSRAEEIVRGGRMVLIIRRSMEANDYMWEFQLLGLGLMDMVAEGLISGEKFREFYLPQHAPTAEDVRKLIEAGGSFTLHKLETFTVNWDVKPSIQQTICIPKQSSSQ